MVENDDFAMSLQCVKALVYYDVQACRLDIGNEKGDTALHVAARWGYQSIIETLLQNGAPTEIQNRQKETPLKCALNSKVVLSISEQLCDYLKKKIRTQTDLPEKMYASTRAPSFCSVWDLVVNGFS